MRNIIEQLVIFILVFTTQFLIVGVFLERAIIDLKRMIRYTIYALIIITLAFWGNDIDSSVTLMALWGVCLCYEGKFIQKSGVILLSIAITCAIGLLDEIVIKHLIGVKDVELYDNFIFGEVRTLIEAFGVVQILKMTTAFNKKKGHMIPISVKQGISISLLAVASIHNANVGFRIFNDDFHELASSKGMALLSAFASLSFILAVIIVFGDDLSKQYYKWVSEHIQSQLERQLKYYQRLEELNKETRSIKHDMKNHMIIMRRLAEKGELEQLKQYIANIENTTEKLDNIQHTGNSIVDAIINEKKAIAAHKEIELKADLQVNSELGMEPMDLCTLLANSIDNALEACEKIECVEERNISISGFCKGGYFLYTIKNTTAMPVEIVNNTIPTKKKDTLNHGYGLINIQKSVKKYKGEFKIEYKENYFSLYIDIPIKTNQVAS